MTGDGRLVEVQATAEQVPFAREQLDELLELAAKGIERIAAAQQQAVERLVAELRSLGWDDTLLRLAVAAALGGAIGLERELDDEGRGPADAHARLGRLGAVHARRRIRVRTSSASGSVGPVADRRADRHRQSASSAPA